jgi:Lar family restriction alleviation protein
MTTELLPCPFCGDAEPVYGEVEGDHHVSSWVMCGSCGCKAYSGDTEPERTAVEAWNSRVPRT